MHYRNAYTGAELLLENESREIQYRLHHGDYFAILWNRHDDSLPISLEGRERAVPPGQLLFLTYRQLVEFSSERSVDILLFNRDFYCVHSHDEEVSCNGLLFFGSDTYPLLCPDRRIQKELALIVQQLREEEKLKDQNQEEMLRLLLKRMIILCTRLARQNAPERASSGTMELVRRFQALVEEHYRDYHRVQDYAALLHIAPKTLTHALQRTGEESPRRFIQKRLVLEAKRMLSYGNESSQEIGYSLGFQDPSHFGKLFRRYMDQSPRQYRESKSREIQTIYREKQTGSEP